MAITINWATKVIDVPKTDMTLIQASPEIRQLNLNTFRLALKDIEDSEAGMTHPHTHNHNTEVTVGGVTLARVIEIINGYTVTFEDGQYAVNLTGANSNLPDVTNVNQVSLRAFNTAGMVVSGSAVTEQDKLDIADRVWDETRASHTTSGTYGEGVSAAAIAGSTTAAARLKESAQTMIVGAVDTASFSPTTTQFETDVVLANTDQIKNRAVFWRSGVLDMHAARITGYQVVSGRGRFTVTAMPAAPSNTDSFVVV